MARLTRKYKDIDLSFQKHPVTGDIRVLEDEAAVKRALKHLILFQAFDVPFHPELSSRLHLLLFENVSPLVSNEMRRIVSEIVRNYEPRIELINIEINPNVDYHQYDIQITFKMISGDNINTLELSIQRIR